MTTMPVTATYEDRIAAYENRIAALTAELDRARKLIQRLSINESFGVLTRNAFQERLRTVDWKTHVVIYFDLDGLKQANDTLTKCVVNLRVRTALAERANDIGQWFSGDEFVAVVPRSDAQGFAQRIQAELRAQGLSATILIQTDSPSIDLAESRMKSLKDRARDTIYVF